MRTLTQSWNLLTRLVTVAVRLLLSALHDFIWVTLRDGVIDLRPFRMPQRILAVVGLGVIFLLIGSLLADGWLRSSGVLEHVGGFDAVLVPGQLVPMTTFALMLSWGYLLAGAVRTMRGIRWSVLVLYLLSFGLQAIGLLALGNQIEQFAQLRIGVISLLSIILLAYLVIPRLRLRPVVEFCVLCGSHAALTLLLLSHALGIQQQFGSNGPTTVLSSIILSNHLLLIPFWLLAGVGLVGAATQMSRWVTYNAYQINDTRGLVAVLVLVLGYRVIASLLDYMPDLTLERGLAFAGAFAVVAGFAVIGRWRSKQHDERSSNAPRMMIYAALGVGTLQLLGGFISGSIIQISTLLIDNILTLQQMVLLSDLLNRLSLYYSNLVATYRLLIAAGAGLLISIWGLRTERHPSVIAVGAILAWYSLLSWVTRTVSWGQPFHWSYRDIEMVFLLALTGSTLWLFIGKKLTRERVACLLGMTVLLALLNQTDMLDNPFSPLFGNAGVYFVAFALLWNVLTAGGGFVNTTSPGISRYSRLMLYMGQALLAAGVAQWYILAHDISGQLSANDSSTTGFTLFGLPLAYLILVEQGRTLAPQAEPAAPDTELTEVTI